MPATTRVRARPWSPCLADSQTSLGNAQHRPPAPRAPRPTPCQLAAAKHCHGRQRDSLAETRNGRERHRRRPSAGASQPRRATTVARAAAVAVQTRGHVGARGGSRRLRRHHRHLVRHNFLRRRRGDNDVGGVGRRAAAPLAVTPQHAHTWLSEIKRLGDRERQPPRRAAAAAAVADVDAEFIGCSVDADRQRRDVHHPRATRRPRAAAPR